MFNKKEMKLITDYKKVQQYLMKGVSVYMVQLDGSLLLQERRSNRKESLSWKRRELLHRTSDLSR